MGIRPFLHPGGGARGQADRHRIYKLDFGSSRGEPRRAEPERDADNRVSTMLNDEDT